MRKLEDVTTKLFVRSSFEIHNIFGMRAAQQPVGFLRMDYDNLYFLNGSQLSVRSD